MQLVPVRVKTRLQERPFLALRCILGVVPGPSIERYGDVGGGVGHLARALSWSGWRLVAEAGEGSIGESGQGAGRGAWES